MNTEPVRIIGWIVAGVTALHQALVAGEALSAAVLAGLIVVGTEIQRSKVTPTP